MSRQAKQINLAKRRHTDSVSGLGPTRGDSPPDKRVSAAEGGDIKGDKLVPKWHGLAAEQLNCSHCLLYTRTEADDLFARCQDEFVYNSGRLAQVRLFGRWRDIPRKQVTHDSVIFLCCVPLCCIPLCYIPLLYSCVIYLCVIYLCYIHLDCCYIPLCCIPQRRFCTICITLLFVYLYSIYICAIYVCVIYLLWFKNFNDEIPL